MGLVFTSLGYLVGGKTHMITPHVVWSRWHLWSPFAWGGAKTKIEVK